jgi:hypothetical protein
MAGQSWTYVGPAILFAIVPCHRALAQLEVRSAPCVGYAKDGRVFALDWRKNERGLYDKVLLSAKLFKEGSRGCLLECPLSYDHDCVSFATWHIAHASLWWNDGWTTPQLGGGGQGLYLPEEHFPYYERTAFEGGAETLRKKYKLPLLDVHYWNLGYPVAAAGFRAAHVDEPDHRFYYDALPLAKGRMVAAALVDSHLLFWSGRAKGPPEAPNSDIDWKEAGKEGKAGFQEAFILFSCGESVVLLTENGKLYQTKVPSAEEVCVTRLWVSTSRPIEAIIGDVDAGAIYAFAAPPWGSQKGYYFALPEVDRRVAFEAPVIETGINQVVAYARILQKDGNLKGKTEKH